MLPGASRFRWTIDITIKGEGLLEQVADIQSERSKSVRIEPIGFALGRAEEISDGGATQSIQKAKDRAFLNYQSSAPVENRLGARIVADGDANRNATALKGATQG